MRRVVAQVAEHDLEVAFVLRIAAPHQRVHAVPHFQPRDAVVDGPQHVVVLPDEVLQQRLPSLLELLLRCPMQRPIGN